MHGLGKKLIQHICTHSDMPFAYPKSNFAPPLIPSFRNRLERYQWNIDEGGDHEQEIHTIFPYTNFILPAVPGDVPVVLPVKLISHLRTSSCENREGKETRAIEFTTAFNIEVEKHLGRRYRSNGFEVVDRSCPDILRDQEGGTTISSWGDTAVVNLACRASSFLNDPVIWLRRELGIRRL